MLLYLREYSIYYIDFLTCDLYDLLDKRRCKFLLKVASASDKDTWKPSMSGASNKSNEYLSICTVYSSHLNTSEVYKMTTFSLNPQNAFSCSSSSRSFLLS